uniref:Uncharacterized protein n=1 Tax=Fundulus heteroclitus TaxID=8078 RepID=A0A3Q2TB63_FUNHE
MKCTGVFLVLSMVVLMAQPGEGIFGLLFHGITQACFTNKVSKYLFVMLKKLYKLTFSLNREEHTTIALPIPQFVPPFLICFPDLYLSGQTLSVCGETKYFGPLYHKQALW